MKIKITLLVTLIIFKLQSTFAGIIHTDPYNIRKTNLSLSPMYFHDYGIGICGSLNHYFINKLSVNLTTFYPVQEYSPQNTYSSSNSKILKSSYKSKPLIIHTLTADFALIDIAKFKKVDVTLKRERGYFGTDANGRSITQRVTNYRTMANVRKIFAITGGIQKITGTERIYNANQEKYKMELYDKSIDKTIILNDVPANNPQNLKADGVYTNVNYTNLVLGAKYKNMLAVCHKSEKYGKKWSEAHFDFHIVGIVTIAQSFDRTVFLKSGTNEKTYEISDRKVKPGFKTGFTVRNIIRQGFTFGSEFGYLPSLDPKGSKLFFNVHLGFSLNFGKINYLPDPGDDDLKKDEK